VAKNNTTFRLKDAKELMYAALGKITKYVWTKAEEHTKPVTCAHINYIGLNSQC
jgi:hypothetical protein